jgi:phosphatidylserine decarboxylase
MMKKFFLSKDLLKKLLVLSIGLYLVMPSSILILWLLVFGIFLALFRKNKVNFKNTLSNSTDILLSPVGGKVTAINDDRTIIEIKVPITGPYGLYMPFSAQVGMFEKFKEEDNKFTKNIKRYSVVLRSKLGATAALELISSSIATEVHVWVKTGDKARSRANFGYMPFGGKIKINLPTDSNILISVGDNIIAGSTILAGIKG